MYMRGYYPDLLHLGRSTSLSQDEQNVVGVCVNVSAAVRVPRFGEYFILLSIAIGGIHVS